MAAEAKSMAERHRDEIAAIISGCEADIAPHKHLAFFRPGSGRAPIGWSKKTASDALRQVTRARAKCSADIRAACERQRAEANANPAAAAALPAPAAKANEKPGAPEA